MYFEMDIVKVNRDQHHRCAHKTSLPKYIVYILKTCSNLYICCLPVEPSRALCRLLEIPKAPQLVDRSAWALPPSPPLRTSQMR